MDLFTRIAIDMAQTLIEQELEQCIKDFQNANTQYSKKDFIIKLDELINKDFVSGSMLLQKIEFPEIPKNTFKDQILKAINSLDVFNKDKNLDYQLYRNVDDSFERTYKKLKEYHETLNYLNDKLDRESLSKLLVISKKYEDPDRAISELNNLAANFKRTKKLDQ